MNTNNIELIGFVGARPLIRESRNGREFATFSVATREYWPESKNVKRTTWHSIITFSPSLISLCKHSLTKGSPVAVQGDITKSKYEKDGVQMISVKVNANDITFLTNQMLSVMREQNNNMPVI